MAEREFNAVMDSIRTALGVHQAQQQQALQQQNIQSEIEARQEAAQRFKDELQQRKDEFNANLALQKQQLEVTGKAAALQHKLYEQQVTKNILEGIPVAGDTSVPTFATGVSAPTSWEHTVMGDDNKPIISGLTLPSQEEFARQQAERARITQAPAEEAKTREAKALQDAELEKGLKIAAQEHINRMAEIGETHKFVLQQQAAQQRSQQAIDAANNASALRRTMITATGGLFGMTDDVSKGIHVTVNEDGEPTMIKQDPATYINNTIDKLRNGTLTSDELKKQDAKGSPLILRLAKQSDVVPLNKVQADNLQDLNVASRVAPHIKNLAELRANYPTQILIPGTDAYKMFEQESDLVKKASPAISRILSNVKRFNVPEIESYLNGLIPSKSPLKGSEAGFAKYNDFVTNDLQQAFDSITNGLGKGQRDILRQNIGLNSLERAISAPGTSPGTPPGATPALPLNPPSGTSPNKKTSKQVLMESPDGKMRMPVNEEDVEYYINKGAKVVGGYYKPRGAGQ